MKVIFSLLFFALLCFAQKPEYCGLRESTRGCLETLAQRFGLEMADEFFADDDVYKTLRGNDKNIFLNNKRNIDKYKEYIHVEVINILEKKAANKKKKDFTAFVADKQGEPDISAERVRNFKESGFYISDYEKYIDGK